jgi:BRCA1-associated protein
MIGAREPAASASKSGAAAAVSSKATSSGHTLGKVQPLTLKGTKCTELGWGIVHLYREGEETPGLNDATAHEDRDITNDGLSGLDTTVLCIPAVPSYMTASDFLGWVGEKTRDEVAHFRMVMTGRMNRYMMLMKFRDGAVARRWKKEWDGKVFNGMEVRPFCGSIHYFDDANKVLCSLRTVMSCSSRVSCSKHPAPATHKTPPGFPT